MSGKSAPNEQVDIARVANRAFIDGRHPRGNCVAAHDRVGYAGLIQNRCDPQQSFAYLGHGLLHAVQDFPGHRDG